MGNIKLLEERFPNSGVKLERVNGLTVWEAHPVAIHQENIFRIQLSLKAVTQDVGGCGCYHYADLSMRFPDGSEKRPDIAIFCQRPQQADEIVTTLPDAVIEVISKGYEAKDYVISLPFYLTQGVKDVVVFNPYTNEVLHCRPDGKHDTFESPVEIQFVCGCVVTV